MCIPMWCLSNPLAEKMLADYPDRVTKDGDLIVLPSHGTAYLGTDFHGKLDFFSISGLNVRILLIKSLLVRMYTV